MERPLPRRLSAALRRAGNASALAMRVAGSPDVFEARGPQSSVNYVTSHDGFTLQDLVTYEQKHNQANGEDNRDGMHTNRSWNCGIEGPSDDEWIRSLRDRERRNLLTILMMSQGIPMLLAGDELGRTQRGNNNAYCQDNEISWVDWKSADPRLAEFVAHLCRLRNEHPALRRTVWLGSPDGRVRPDGLRFFDSHAVEIQAGEPVAMRNGVEILIPGRDRSVIDRRSQWTDDADFLLLCNIRDYDTLFSIPSDGASKSWWRVVDTGSPSHVGAPFQRASGVVTVRAHAMMVLMGVAARHA
jgi:glycogen operon protein